MIKPDHRRKQKIYPPPETLTELEQAKGKIKALSNELLLIKKEKETLKEKAEHFENEKNDAEKSIKEQIEIISVLESELDTVKNISMENEKRTEFENEMKEKDEKIRKLSEIVQKRSGAKSKATDNRIDEQAQVNDTIKKVKSEAAKTKADEIKTKINETKDNLDTLFSTLLKSLNEHLVVLENTLLAKDNISQECFKKQGLFLEETAKELGKYKNLYLGLKSENGGKADIVQDERIEKFSKLEKDIQRQISEVNDSIGNEREELKEAMKNIEEQLNATRKALSEHESEYEKAQKEWLFLLQDFYKDKYFEVQNLYDEQKLDLEEKHIEVSILKDRVANLENKLSYYRFQDKAG